MAYETILCETDGAIATITLNRPEKFNAIVAPMPEEVEAAAKSHPDVWDAVVVGVPDDKWGQRVSMPF